LGSIFPGPKGTLQFFGGTYNGDIQNGSGVECIYVGSFTPKAPDADQQQQTLRVKPKPGLRVSCGPSGVNTCFLSTTYAADLQGADLDVGTGLVQYSFVNQQPQLLVTLQYGADFGLCDIKTTQGYAVVMDYSYLQLGLRAINGLEPTEVEAWLYSGISAAKTGAIEGQEYKCTFVYELDQSLNGGPLEVIASGKIEQFGEVGQ
jgi:hypothetical protein